MSDQINLKDELYLKDYAGKIHNLPLGELYEVLGVVKKDSSDERVKIVMERIHELEAEIQTNKSNKKKKVKVKPVKAAREDSANRESPVKLFIRKLFWISLMAVFVVSRVQDVAHKILDGSFDVTECGITFTMDILPFFCFGIGYKIARRFTMAKKKKFHLGVAFFLMGKAVLGICLDVYLGVACQFYDEKASYVSVIVLAAALLFTVNMFRRKVKDKFATNGMLPMAIALLAEQQIWMM